MKTIYFFLSFLILGQLNAQDNFGSLHSNYSPTNSVHINPSSILDAKTWFDIHIIGAGSYINNNFIAAEKTTVKRLIPDFNISSNNLHFRTNKSNYHAYNRSFINAFGFVISQGDHAFGLSTNGYAYSDIRNIDNVLGTVISDAILNQDQTLPSSHTLKNLKMHAMSYAELKLTYAHTFNKQKDDLFMFGVSVKKIFPIAAVGIKINELTYTVLNNNTSAILNQLTSDIMYNSSPEFSLNGGLGLDLGFTYQLMESPTKRYYPNSKKGGCSRKYYIFKIGVSLNDIGYVKYNEGNTETYGFTESNINLNDFDQVNSIEDVLNQVNQNTNDGIINNPNRMRLPTSLSVQFDYRLMPNFFYINGTINHGFGTFKNNFGPRRASSLSVSPRIETKWFDVSLPLSVYEYSTLQLGLSARLYLLTIGTDKLLNFFIPSNIYGADFYFAFKVPIFYNPSCGSNSKSNGSNSKFRKKRKYKKCAAYR